MRNSARFNGKVLLVTGAAQGIGREVALEAAREGAKTVLVDRSELVLDVAAQIEAGGGEALALLADLEHYDENTRITQLAVERFGAIHILVTNIGGAIWMKPFEHFEPPEIEAEIRRSLFPTLWGCHAVLPHMLAQGGGSIVNISSIATRGINRMPYSAAKGGVNALTASLAFELAEKNIRVNAVAPGGTSAPARKIPRNTATQSQQDKDWIQQVVDQTVESSLMKRYGTLEEQCAAILFLASDEASYITGTVLPVGGGDLG